MIQRVRIIDANYSGLETKFPVGLELDLDSNIMLLVGPNGAGKTGFMRMLATSLRNNNFYCEHGFSPRMFHVDDLGGERGGAFSGFNSSGRDKILYLRQILNDSSYCQDGLWEIKDQDKVDALKTLARYAAVPDLEQLVIKQERPTPFLLEWSSKVREKGYEPTELVALHHELIREDVLRPSPDEVFKKHFKTRPSRPNFIEGIYRVPIDVCREEVAELIKLLEGHGVSPALYTHHALITSDVRDRVVDYLGGFCVPTERNQWGYIVADVTPGSVFFFEYHMPDDRSENKWTQADVAYSHFREKNVGRTKESPGLLLRRDLEGLFGHIKCFLEEGKAINAYNGSIVQHLDIDTNQALVLMDEPTIWLDYRNKGVFRDLLVETARQFGERVQFIIPTNDGVLIAGVPGCKYLDLYQTPAKSVSDFSF